MTIRPPIPEIQFDLENSTGLVVLTLSWGQGKLRPASAAQWPWLKVTQMGAKKISQVNHVWFEEISFRGFPGKLKSVGRTATAVETDKKNQVPRLPRVT